MSDRPYIYPLLIAVALTVGVRTALIAVSPDAFSGDPDAYGAIALTLAESGVFGLSFGDGPARATAFRPPLYPWVISHFVSGDRISELGIGVLHVLLATLTTFFVFDTVVCLSSALRFFGGTSRPPCSACSPHWSSFSIPCCYASLPM